MSDFAQFHELLESGPSCTARQRPLGDKAEMLLEQRNVRYEPERTSGPALGVKLDALRWRHIISPTRRVPVQVRMGGSLSA